MVIWVGISRLSTGREERGSRSVGNVLGSIQAVRTFDLVVTWDIGLLEKLNVCSQILVYPQRNRYQIFNHMFSWLEDPSLTHCCIFSKWVY